MADLIRVLGQHARQRPEQQAFVYLQDGQSDDQFVTYAQLDRRARAIAARLQEMGLAGQRVLLAYPHGLEFIAGFFGCLYAGCTAVPTTSRGLTSAAVTTPMDPIACSNGMWCSGAVMMGPS